MTRRTRVRPSKVVGAVVATPEGDVALVTSHFLSKRNASNDEPRAAQADAVRQNFLSLFQRNGVRHGIVLGDLNDTPNSLPLTILTSNGILKNTLYSNNRTATSNDCSFTYAGECELIDHILKTDSLAGGEFRIVQTDRQFTDHHAVQYRLRAN